MRMAIKYVKLIHIWSKFITEKNTNKKYKSWQVKSIFQAIPPKNRNRIDSIFKPKSRNRIENSIPTFRY